MREGEGDREEDWEEEGIVISIAVPVVVMSSSPSVSGLV